MKSTVNTPHAPAAIGPYSQGTISRSNCSLLFTAGQIPMDPVSGAIVGTGIKAQAKQVLENLRGIIEDAGASLSNVLKVTIYLKNLEHYTELNEVYSSYFQSEPPARSAVEVGRLPKDVLVEMDAIVALDRA